jgi:hypothetical protein
MPTLRLRLATILLTLAAAITLAACGDSSSTTNSGPVARFTPDTPTPGAATISLAAGGATGAAVAIKINVTDVNGFFGTAFRITYDPDALLFTGWDYSSSFLLSGINASDAFFQENHNVNGGEIVVTATRLDPSAVSAVNVTGTQTLATLNFTARRPLGVGSPDGRVEFGDPKQVCDGTVSAPGCGAVTVTWSGGGVSAQ